MGSMRTAAAATGNALNGAGGGSSEPITIAAKSLRSSQRWTRATFPAPARGPFGERAAAVPGSAFTGPAAGEAVALDDDRRHKRRRRPALKKAWWCQHRLTLINPDNRSIVQIEPSDGRLWIIFIGESESFIQDAIPVGHQSGQRRNRQSEEEGQAEGWRSIQASREAMV